MYFTKQKNWLIICDPNAEVNLNCMQRFSETYDRNSHKITGQPLCIDLLLINRPDSFQNSSVIETGL